MKIVLLHYHLKPGGVTTVLQQPIKAAENFGEVLVITGEAPEEGLPVETITIPGIAYDTVKKQETPPLQVAAEIMAGIKSKWSDGCDVIHVHNPTLAKNGDFLKIIKALQKAGLRLFLQIHDLAEDGRPGSYFEDEYPQNCHYGVINSRDYRFLKASGLKKEGLHLVPNAVILDQSITKEEISENYVLYPVRAIRRKNLGEAILNSLFFTDGQALWITLPPNSPGDQPSYYFWREFCRMHDLNVSFEKGLEQDIHSLLSSARTILSTSIMEGFGFSFIESWGLGKLIRGRYLREICSDFETLGISLSHLYKGIQVPVEWIGLDEYLAEWKTLVEATYEKYKANLPIEKLQSAMGKLKTSKTLDFGMLNEKYQSRVLMSLLKSGANRNQLMKRNPFLGDHIDYEGVNYLIHSNAKRIKQVFGEAAFQESLVSIYRKVIDQPVPQKIDKQELLKHYLNLDEFSLLKWGGFNG
jgi:glycosyltransferase involved in cell wall biosynthesis